MSDLLDEIEYLKKSLKNKRKGEIWEQSIQFYRNHISAITNFHIIKLIKIAFRPIKWTILKSCKYIGKLSIRHSSRSQTKKSMELIRDQLNSLKIKLSALSNLLQSYTVSLQSFLCANDSTYFKMIFRQNYQIKHELKHLIFQPSSTESQIQLQKKKIQHQVQQYLKFVLESCLLFSKSIICCTPIQEAVRFFKQIDRNTEIIFGSSHKFAFKKLELDILKLNIITNQKIDYEMYYQIPIEIFYRILKDYKRISPHRTKHCFNLLIRYLFIAFFNVNNTCLLFHPSSKYQKTENYIETEIYLFMKEILFVYNYVNLKQKSLISKSFLETISAFIESYELRFEESRRWVQFLKKYFRFELLKKIQEEKKPTKEQEVLQIVTLALNKKDQQRINKLQQQDHRKVNPKKVSYSFSSCQKMLIDHRKMEKLMQKIGNSFPYIQESDEEQDGRCSHKFQQGRREKILELDTKVRRGRKENINHQQAEDSNKKCENLSIIEGLIQECSKFSVQTVKAIDDLKKKRRANSQLLKLKREQDQYLHVQLYPKQVVQGSHKENVQINESRPKQQMFKLKRRQQDFRIENEISLANQGITRPEKKPSNSQKILVSLSDKYDHLRKTLLLNNKKKNLFI